MRPTVHRAGGAEGPPEVRRKKRKRARKRTIEDTEEYMLHCAHVFDAKFLPPREELEAISDCSVGYADTLFGEMIGYFNGDVFYFQKKGKRYCLVPGQYRLKHKVSLESYIALGEQHKLEEYKKEKGKVKGCQAGCPMTHWLMGS